MPVLPRLETSQSVFSEGTLQSQQVNATPESFGGITAQAAGQMAGAFGHASAETEQTAVMYKAINDETRSNDIYANGLSPEVDSLQSQLHSLQGRNAVDQGPKILQAVRDAQTKYRDALTDPQQKLMYDRVATQRTQRTILGMQDYIDNQNKVYQGQVSDGMVASMQKQAASVWNDPSAFNGYLQSIAVERQSHANVTGEPADFVNAKIQRDTSASWIDRLRGIAAAGSAQTALTLLKNGEDWTDSTGRTRHTDVWSQIEPNSLAALQSELASHAADQIGVQYGTQATTPTPSSESLGVRNNNPGNLRDPGTGQFQRFSTPQQGIQAADDNLAAYGSKHGIDTIAGIINRWAPAGDGNNNPSAYAATVAKATGIAADAKVNLADPATRTKILNAMFDVESPGWRDASKAQPVGAAAGAVSGTLPVGNAAGVPNAAAIAPPPTGIAHDPEAMRADQDARAEQARKDAEAHVLQLTGNPEAAKRAGSVAASTVVGNTNAAIAGAQARQREAAGALAKMLAGDPASGAAPITSFAQLTANPVAYANYSQLSPEGQAAVTERLTKAEHNAPLTQDGLNAYYRLRGESANDAEGFMKEDLSKLYGQMPDHLILDLMNRQASVSKTDAAKSAKDMNFARAKSEVDDMLKPMGLGRSSKPNSDEAATTSTFYGKLEEALDQFHDQNKKWPDTKTTRQIAAGLIAQGSQEGAGWFGLGGKDMMAFQSPDLSKFSVPVPDDQKPQLASTFKRVMGHAPTDDELNQWYTRYTLSKGRK